MLLILAQLISYLSNPLVIVLPSTYALVYKSTGSPATALWWALFSLFFAALIGVFVLYGIRKGFFNDIDVSERKKRKPLFIVASIIIFVYFLAILFLNGPKILLVGVTGVLLGILLDTFINSKIKASVHVATFSAFIFSLAILYGGIFIYCIVFIPLVAWARIKTKRHTKQETFVGALLGITLIAVVYVVVKLLIQ